MVAVAGTFAAQDKWQTLAVQCLGGLNTSVDTLSYKPGEAFQLYNFEPGLYGGYRRLSGFQLYSATVVPGSGKVLGVCAFPGASAGIIACRQNSVYFGTGGVWGSAIATRTGALKYRFTKYLLGGVQKVAMCDGVNQAATWDGTTYTLLTGTGSPTNPKYCTFWLNRLVVAGYSANPKAISITAPNTDNDFTGVNGAIEINTSGRVTGIRNFRGTLYVFCTHEIFEITGTSSANFAMSPIASEIGCLAPDSIQEINGNLVYLTADGIRTVAGTERIGDVGLASISKHILSVVTNLISTAGDAENISSLVVHGKNQYRLFYPSASNTEADSLGLVGAIRQGHSVNETAFGRIIDEWEWGQIQGIKPYCCDSDFFSGVEIVVHGGFDGFVYQQELGNAFNGANINASYLTAPLQLDDVELRKLMQKLDVFYRVEGTTSINANMVYDFGDPSTPQPGTVTITEGGGLVVYDAASSLYDTSLYSVSRLNPKIISNIQGSGFIIQILFSSNDMNPSYSIQAFTLTYRTLGRR